MWHGLERSLYRYYYGEARWKMSFLKNRGIVRQSPCKNAGTQQYFT